MGLPALVPAAGTITSLDGLFIWSPDTNGFRPALTLPGSRHRSRPRRDTNVSVTDTKRGRGNGFHKGRARLKDNCGKA